MRSAIHGFPLQRNLKMGKDFSLYNGFEMYIVAFMV
jgi:hypothetical protein